MVTRRQALAVSSPAIGVLLVTLVWNAVDYHWLDRAVRWLADRD